MVEPSAATETPGDREVQTLPEIETENASDQVTVHACTIVARNYLPAARVLARSFAAHHPGGTFTTLVIDDLFGEVDEAREPFDVVHPDALGISGEELHRFIAIYSIMELATALKPWLLETLIDRFAAPVMYLDPDIVVYESLEPLAALAMQHEIVLTPHATRPLPRDGRWVTETQLLGSGIYNLGFIALGREAKAFLKFWKERLERECVVDLPNNRFVDQRWIDFAPGMFDVAIVRDPQYNVAYWNLDHRDLTFADGRYLIDGSPLRFFHFSGFNPLVPHILSKHQGAHPRILLSERPALSRLCAEYGRDLIGAEYEKCRETEYGYAHLADGTEFDSAMRRLYREELVAAEASAKPYPPNPFDAAGPAAFLDWACEAPTPGGLPRLLSALIATRADLQAAFPDPEGRDRARVEGWVRHEVEIGRLDASLYALPGGESAAALEPPRAPLRPGVRVAAYFRAEMGVGEHGRLALTTIEAAGIEHSTFVDEHTVVRQMHPFVEHRVDDLNVNLICVNADELPNFARRVGPSFFEGRYSIGLWAWEIEEFPSRFLESFDYLDEIWAVSSFARDAIATHTRKPVYTFSNPIVAPVVDPDITREALGLPDGALFLFCFDLMSIVERKNPGGLIEAFRRAFPRPGTASLVIKVTNGDLKPYELEEIKLSARERSDIVVIDEYLTAAENAALMSLADAYVSLHRSEGFGLTMAEAMALGKPVIATGYSGNLDFMSSQTAMLIPFTRVEIPPGADPYPAGAWWAEPDLDEAAAAMRSVVEDPDAARALGERAREYVLEAHSPDAHVPFVLERFDHAQTVLASRAPATPAVDSPLATASLTELVSRAPSTEGPSRHPRLARAYRRLVRRALRHQSDAQREIDLVLATRLEGLELELQNERERAQRHRLDVARIEAQMARVLEEIARSRTVLESHATGVRALRREVAEIAAADEVRDEDLGELARRLREHDSDAHADALAIVGELRARPYMADASEFLVDLDGREVLGFGAGATADGYRGFEDVFRGSEEFIRDRMRYYVPVLRAHEPVVELGSGRGELLGLLAADHIAACGVERDPTMAARLRDLGLEVAETDALSHLRSIASARVGAVVGIQLVEHLDYPYLVDLLRECRRVLRPGGIAVFETVNPHSVAAFRTFWTDPTHRTPLFPEVLLALVRSAGFERAQVEFPNGGPDLERNLRSAGEYAVIAANGDLR